MAALLRALQAEMMKRVSYKLIKELMKDLAAVFAGGDQQECLARGQAENGQVAARMWQPCCGTDWRTA